MKRNVFETNNVFGVSNEEIYTYIEREKVDSLFLEGLTKNKHIIIYGLGNFFKRNSGLSGIKYYDRISEVKSRI